MSFTPLTPDTQLQIAQDFSPEDQLAAAELLEQNCGSSLPLIGDRLPEEAGFVHSVLAHRTWFSEHTGG